MAVFGLEKRMAGAGAPSIEQWRDLTRSRYLLGGGYILAFILKVNGYPAGTRDLDSDLAALKTIRLAAPVGILPK